ncbi:AraC family transcriptional regulator [Bacteroides sp. 224]|uniref:helix-turn-helix domain-containing protein n=1 Tax=Bacteroides sp. 224 TaxID=2302936 RepID=UPI0013D08F84|nr:AraC family transcriptional regulator [Bacteroides sp. 224]NDV64630.1 AraC family transcriptional regulator [Bacteroides sp. 224]
MKKLINIKNISDLLFDSLPENEVRKKINCVILDKYRVDSNFSFPVILNASISILVLSGKAILTSNHEAHNIVPDTIVVLSVSHLFSLSECSDDFKCLCLFVGKDFTDEMDSTDMINKRIRYGVKLFNKPVLSLRKEEAFLLHEKLLAIDKAISNTTHLYYKEVILNTLLAFYLDLSHIIDIQTAFNEEDSLTRYESIIKLFIELLVTHYRKEHGVDFYASRLNISSHYLTLIVKRSTGQSVTDFIYEMLYSEARTLLEHSKLSIQEIAATLNFADQSSFGKFFKRRADISPKDFRKRKFTDR